MANPVLSSWRVGVTHFLAGLTALVGVAAAQQAEARSNNQTGGVKTFITPGQVNASSGGAMSGGPMRVSQTGSGVANAKGTTLVPMPGAPQVIIVGPHGYYPGQIVKNGNGQGIFDPRNEGGTAITSNGMLYTNNRSMGGWVPAGEVPGNAPSGLRHFGARGQGYSAKQNKNVVEFGSDDGAVQGTMARRADGSVEVLLAQKSRQEQAANVNVSEQTAIERARTVATTFLVPYYFSGHIVPNVIVVTAAPKVKSVSSSATSAPHSATKKKRKTVKIKKACTACCAELVYWTAYNAGMQAKQLQEAREANYWRAWRAGERMQHQSRTGQALQPPASPSPPVSGGTPGSEAPRAPAPQPASPPSTGTPSHGNIPAVPSSPPTGGSSSFLAPSAPASPPFPPSPSPARVEVRQPLTLLRTDAGGMLPFMATYTFLPLVPPADLQSALANAFEGKLAQRLSHEIVSERAGRHSRLVEATMMGDGLHVELSGGRVRFDIAAQEDGTFTLKARGAGFGRGVVEAVLAKDGTLAVTPNVRRDMMRAARETEGRRPLQTDAKMAETIKEALAQTGAALWKVENAASARANIGRDGGSRFLRPAAA